MKFLTNVALIGLIACGASLSFATPSEAGKKRETRYESARLSFAPHDVVVIREYYAPRYQRLPPGLQKKLQRTGQLPPGWQKRFEPFPVAVERQLVVLPRGYRRGVIDGHAVLFDARTHVIIDVAALF